MEYFWNCWFLQYAGGLIEYLIAITTPMFYFYTPSMLMFLIFWCLGVSQKSLPAVRQLIADPKSFVQQASTSTCKTASDLSETDARPGLSISQQVNTCHLVSSSNGFEFINMPQPLNMHVISFSNGSKAKVFLLFWKGKIDDAGPLKWKSNIFNFSVSSLDWSHS